MNTRDSARRGCVDRAPYGRNSEKVCIGAMKGQQDGSSIVMSLASIIYQKSAKERSEPHGIAIKPDVVHCKERYDLNRRQSPTAVAGSHDIEYNYVSPSFVLRTSMAAYNYNFVSLNNIVSFRSRLSCYHPDCPKMHCLSNRSCFPTCQT